jgi:hypothetical protein
MAMESARWNFTRSSLESCKIWRLEFILDKIEDGDSKRKVVHIRFGCPTKKNGLG